MKPSSVAGTSTISASIEARASISYSYPPMVVLKLAPSGVTILYFAILPDPSC